MNEKVEKTAETVAKFFHPFVGIVVVCSLCDKRAKHGMKFCPTCGARFTNSNDEFSKGHFRALDLF